MASISIRRVGGKPRYDVNYREPDGRRRRKTFVRKLDADNFATTVEADKLRGIYLDPDAGRMTFQTYAEQRLASQTTEATTKERIDSRLRRHVYPALGNKPLAQIKPSTVQAWLAGLQGAASTRHVTLGTVWDSLRRSRRRADQQEPVQRPISLRPTTRLAPHRPVARRAGRVCDRKAL